MKKDNLRIDNVLDKSLKGWLPVKDITGKDYKLFYSTSVEKTKSKKYLIVTEGEAKNKTVSIEYHKIHPNLFSNYYSNDISIESNCRIVVAIKERKLYYRPKKDEFCEIYIGVQDLDYGVYKILLPTKKTDKVVSTNYINEHNGGSRFAETWFPFMKDRFEERYIHFGTYSRGCVTVVHGQTDAWNNLYLYLIKSRKVNNIIGDLIVIDELK